MPLILALVRHRQKGKEFKVNLSYKESLGRPTSNNQINKQTKLTKFRHIRMMLEVVARTSNVPEGCWRVEGAHSSRRAPRTGQSKAILP